MRGNAGQKGAMLACSRRSVLCPCSALQFAAAQAPENDPVTHSGSQDPSPSKDGLTGDENMTDAALDEGERMDGGKEPGDRTPEGGAVVKKEGGVVKAEAAEVKLENEDVPSPGAWDRTVKIEDGTVEIKGQDKGKADDAMETDGAKEEREEATHEGDAEMDVDKGPQEKSVEEGAAKGADASDAETKTVEAPVKREVLVSGYASAWLSHDPGNESHGRKCHAGSGPEV